MGKNSNKASPRIQKTRESRHESGLAKHKVVAVVFDDTSAGDCSARTIPAEFPRVTSELYYSVRGLPRGRAHLLHSTSLRW